MKISFERRPFEDMAQTYWRVVRRDRGLTEILNVFGPMTSLADAAKEAEIKWPNLGRNFAKGKGPKGTGK